MNCQKCGTEFSIYNRPAKRASVIALEKKTGESYSGLCGKCHNRLWHGQPIVFQDGKKKSEDRSRMQSFAENKLWKCINALSYRHLREPDIPKLDPDQAILYAQSAKEEIDQEIRTRIQEIEALHKRHQKITELTIKAEQVYGEYLLEDYKARQKAEYKITNQLRLRLIVFARDGNKCCHCSSSERLEVDHVIPIIKGGKSHLENLQTLCRSCNAKKGSKIEQTQ